MMLPLNPDVLRSCYDYLNSTKPFCNWNLPDGEDVIFKVCKSRDHYAEWAWMSRHRICVSSVFVRTTPLLLMKMAHEMIHVHEWEVRTGSKKTAHNAAFHLFADDVCLIHGFDRGMF